jgi:hypothetical protein
MAGDFDLMYAVVNTAERLYDDDHHQPELTMFNVLLHDLRGHTMSER